MTPLTDRTVVITGAASGIGYACCLAFADAGCHIAAVDRNADGLSETADAIAEQTPGCRVNTYVVDVTDADAVDELAEDVADDFGDIHVVINNAGINVTGSFEEHSLEDFRRVFDVNLWGVIHGCRSFLPYLKRAGRGHIVNLSSLFGIVGVAGQSAYSASKFAVRGLSESLHEELADTDVSVTVVHPGCIKTSIIDDATIHDADSVDRIHDYFSKHGCEPDVVARRIVDAVEDNTHRLLVTAESRAFDWLRRITPTRGNRLANRLMGWMVGITPGNEP